MAKVILKDLKKVYPNTEKKKKVKKGEEPAEKKNNLQITDEGVVAVQQFNLEIADKEFIVLVGPSGCGKSTLLSAIAGLEPLTGGAVSVAGQPVTGPSRRVGFMPQRDQLFEWKSIWDNVTLGLAVQRERGSAAYDHVRELLDRYELSGFAGKRPCQLSGGMRQRCALIRTLASDPEILLLDEPFSALDYQTRLAVSADIWRIIRQEGKTALLVTHDIAEAVSMSDRVVVLSARPAVVKTVLDMGALRGLPPLERRSTAEFHRYFDLIWKELDVHG